MLSGIIYTAFDLVFNSVHALYRIVTGGGECKRCKRALLSLDEDEGGGPILTYHLFPAGRPRTIRFVDPVSNELYYMCNVVTIPEDAEVSIYGVTRSEDSGDSTKEVNLVKYLHTSSSKKCAYIYKPVPTASFTSAMIELTTYDDDGNPVRTSGYVDWCKLQTVFAKTVKELVNP